MTKTKHSLFMSAIALLLCCSMLIGTTFAWFTDSVTSSNNKIQSGTLKVDLELLDKTTDTWNSIKTSKAPIFNYDNWEPGYTDVKILKIENEGTLALKWVAQFTSTAALSILADVIDVYVDTTVTSYPTDRDAVANWTYAGTVKEFVNTIEQTTNGILNPKNTAGDTAYLGIALKMREEAGNDYQGKDLGGAFDIVIYATQLTSEEDSFDENYDKDAVVTATSSQVTLPAIGEAAVEQTITTPIENNVTLTLSADFLSDLAQVTDAPASVALSHAEPRINTSNNTVTLDHIDLIDENGDVIDLEALGNDEPITVKFNVGNAFNVGDTVIVYHDGEIVASPVVDADKNITYTATHFCEVTVGYNDGKIDTAKELLVTTAAAEDGDVITLAGNIEFNKDAYSDNGGWKDGLLYVGDKSFTIDLNDYTITNDSFINDYLLNFKNDGEKENVITIKNGTLDATSSAYCAVCTSTTSTQKVTINLENINLYGNNSNGSVAKIRGGAELNVKSGTVINGKNSYLGIESWAATINIYDGAEIYQNGTTSYNGCLVGVGGNGTINAYGGYGKGAKGGFIAMTSGGTINVYGGKWIANKDGSIGDNSNLYVLTAQSNANEPGFAGGAFINVYGGTFRGGMDAWVLNNVPDEQAGLNISGGNFNANPERYVVSERQLVKNDGIWTVGTSIVTTADELKAAIKGANDGDAILIANDITVSEDWDRRYTGSNLTKEITIDGLGYTLKFTGKVHDGFNYHCAFRFEAPATVKNLTFDMSEVVYASAWIRAISATNDLTVDNCTFIGPNDTTINKDNAIQIGDTNASSQIDADVVITNCTFTNWRRGVSDNENAKEVKNVTLSGNTFNTAPVYVSAFANVEITGNKFDNGLVNITSYTNAANVKVVATENELDADCYNTIGSASKLFTKANVNAQEGFIVSAN